MAFKGDGESINTSGWTPKAPYNRTTTVLCITAGTLKVNMCGTQPGVAGAAGLSIPMLAGQELEIGVTAVLTGSSGSFLAFY